jgi:large subunit ribosomal protein L13
LKEITAEELHKKFPERLIYLAVKGMLPKNFQRWRMLKRLKIYPEEYHFHSAQNPEPLNI